MSNQELLEQILASARLGESFGEKEGQYQSFGWIDPIVFDGDRFSVYENNVSRLYQSNPEIISTYSREAFVLKLIEQIRPIVVDGAERKKCSWKDLEREILAIPIGRVQVFSALHGVSFDQGAPPLKLGHFTLWSSVHHKELLLDIAPRINKDAWEEPARQVVIGVEADVRDSRRALELAHEKFEMFEQVVAFFLGRNEQFEVGVNNYRGSYVRKSLIATEVAGTENSLRAGAIKRLNISQPFFIKPPRWAKAIWGICSDGANSKMAKRVRAAVIWHGQSCREPHLPTAFVKAAISLEILLGYNEKDIIAPSILAHISECVALMVGSEADEKISIERDVKRLYGIRSKIVHEGSSVLDIADLRHLLQLSSTAIRIVIDDPAFAHVKEPGELFQLLKRRKYGGH